MRLDDGHSIMKQGIVGGRGRGKPAPTASAVQRGRGRFTVSARSQRAITTIHIQSPSSLSAHYASRTRYRESLRAAVCIEPVVDVFEMLFDGGDAENKLVRDIPVGEADGDKLEYFHLARAERVTAWLFFRRFLLC